MARLITCGWESNDANEFGVFSGGAPQAVVTSNPLPRSPGQYCWKVGGGTTGTGIRTRTLPAPKNNIWLRFAVWLQGANTEYPLCSFTESSQTRTVGCLTWSVADQSLRLYRGLVTEFIASSAPLQMPINMWHTIELHWQIISHDAGNIELWVDDQRWLNLSGIDATYATATSGQPDIGSITLGQNYQNYTSTIYAAYDDVAVNDTTGSVNNSRVGEGRIVALRPNGVGAYSNQTRGGTDTGANWSQVSEIPPSMSQYVQSAVVGTRDTYALSDVPAGSWTVNAIEVMAYSVSSDTGPSQLGMNVISGPVEARVLNESPPQLLTVGNTYVRSTWDVDPATGAAWTVSALNALEAGTTAR